MSYSSSYESSLSSSTGTTTVVETTTEEETSSSSLSVEMSTQATSPDDSDGLAAALGGEAIAIGEDTLTVGTVSAEMDATGAITTLDGEVDMLAASESPEDPAVAITDSFADVSDGADFVYTATVTSSSTEQTSTGSTATSSSTTDITAYDLDLSSGEGSSGGDGVADSDIAETGDQEASTSTADLDEDLEGNVAVIEFDATAFGDDTYVSVDAFALAIEDELSASGAVVELAVE